MAPESIATRLSLVLLLSQTKEGGAQLTCQRRWVVWAEAMGGSQSVHVALRCAASRRDSPAVAEVAELRHAASDCEPSRFLALRPLLRRPSLAWSAH
jgi:hypothetical protein